MTELEQKNAEIVELRAALRECVLVLDGDALQNAFVFLYIHGYTYNGPSINMKKMRSLCNFKELV